MEPAEMQWAALVGHPATRGEPALRIDAQGRVEKSGAIVFRYVLRAEMSRVRVPVAEIPGAGARADGLWKHTCFEAFIMVAGVAGYYELNFAPSRQWAIYRFDAYREGMASPEIEAPPEIAVRRFDARLEVDATVQLRDLNALQGARHPAALADRGRRGRQWYAFLLGAEARPRQTRIFITRTALYSSWNYEVWNRSTPSMSLSCASPWRAGAWRCWPIQPP